MTGEWKFNPLPREGTTREPLAALFFASDAIRNATDALIRESIQNSLDAVRVKDGNKARVHISILSGKSAPTGNNLGRYFLHAVDHYRAEENGLSKFEIPDLRGTCPLLIIEDFGTRGLEGDYKEYRAPRKGNKNHFYFFFRAEGKTDKGNERSRGSWGLGKDTFYQSSLINTLFGLTIREHGCRKLLMGKTVLKSHTIKDDKKNVYQEGFYCLNDRSDPFAFPIEDSGDIARFCNDFQLTREGQTGLSVVIPWPLPEITFDEIVFSILRNYTYSIMVDELEVEISDGKDVIFLDSCSLPKESSNFVDSLDKVEEANNLKKAIDISIWASKSRKVDPDIELKCPVDARSWAWTKDLFPGESLNLVSERVQNQEFVFIRAYVKLRPKKENRSKPSYFDIYLKGEDYEEQVVPVCIRDGLTITQARVGNPRRNVRSLLLFEERTITTYLRESENPSHTEWLEKNLRGKYITPEKCLRFIRGSVREICRLAESDDKNLDKTLLSKYFPSHEGIDQKERENPERPHRPRDLEQRSNLSIYEVKGGFGIRPGKEFESEANRIDIQVAYAARGKDAFKSYLPSDFQLDLHPITCKVEGAEIESVLANKMSLRIVSPYDFRLIVKGFDPSLELFVKAE